MRRAIWPFLLSVAVVGALFLLVFPARTYWTQRRSLVAAETKVKVLNHENQILDQRVAKLHDDAEIERLAREQYGMVKPGEEAYAILPPPASTTPSAPAAKPAAARRNIFQRAWHAVF